MTAAELTVEWWPTEKPTPYARNPRQAPEAAISQGRRQPQGVRLPPADRGRRATASIIAGHTRLLGAKRLGLEQVPVHVATGLTPEQVKAYRIADNRSAQETTWDYELLPLELSELEGAGYDLALTGFDPERVRGLPRRADRGADRPRCRARRRRRSR